MARLSKYQKEFGQAIYDLAQGRKVCGKNHITLNAKAGSGKTFTITYFMKYIPATQRGVAVMFNKRNADDIQKKLPSTGHIQGLTTHSLGMRVCKRAGVGRLDDDKMRHILKNMQMTFQERQLLPQIRKLIGIAKADGLVPSNVRGAWSLIPETPDVWADYIDRFQLEFEEPWQEETAISYARTALKLSIDNAHVSIDFDDMLYLPVVMRMIFPKYQWVFIDEAQDINRVQREMVKRSLAPATDTTPGGHLIAVGDPNQAIYGFRGADSESMNRIKEEVDAHEMPLSVCYRCDKNVVREAKKVVPAIEYHDEREEGTVTMAIPGVTREEKLASLTADSAILCPFNAPLVEVALALIGKKIACHMVGRDFAEGIVKLLEKLQAVTAKEAERKLEQYFSEEYVRLIEREQENKAQALQDKRDALMAFLEDAPENETVERIIARIHSLFDDSAAGMLTLSSIHRAKGGEWKRVFFLESEVLGWTTRKRGGKMVELLPWEIQQKRNLLYVGITRAQNELIFVKADEMVKLIKG